LGLQHTLTSSVMSTGPTRGTSKAQPLAADDIAGVSLLYPVAGWLATTGTIQGHVLLQSTGVNMASVVALSTNGTVVSTLSNPDGFYKIAGLPLGQYYVYAHPLPPAQTQLGEVTPANINYPVDAQNNPFPANIQFDTQFYGGTRDWTQSQLLSVAAPGAVLDGVNFSMQKRNGPAIYAVTTYGYEGPVGQQVAVASAPLPVGTRTRLVFSGPGMAQSGRVTPNLNINVIGNAALAEPGTLTYYGNFSGFDYEYMTVDANQMMSDANGVPFPTPVALAMTTPTDLFVLPAAFSVAPMGPPTITSVVGSTDSQGNPLATIVGANLGGTTRIEFDGAPATIQSVASDGSLTVVAAPPALGSYNAVVAALASDGQSSTQALGSAAPPLFSYAPQAGQFISVNKTSLAAGTDTTLNISGSGVSFVDGQVVVGFGSSDIVVKRVWWSSQGLLQLNVSLSPAAQAGPVTVTVISGLQLMTTTMQVLPYTAGTATLLAPVTDLVTGLAGVAAGGTAVIGTSGLPSNLAGWTLSIGGANATITQVGANQLQAQVPPGSSVGLAAVQLTSPSGNGPPPILMQIDGPPPVINAVLNASGLAIDAAHAAQIGDAITVNVSGLDTFTESHLRIAVGGVAQAVQSIAPAGQPGSFLLTFLLSPQTPAGAQMVTVGLDTDVSAGMPIVIRPSDNSSQQRHR
jgi:hypothetical protein